MIVIKHRAPGWFLAALCYRRMQLQAEINLRSWALTPMVCFRPFAVGVQIGSAIVSVGRA